MWGTHQITMDEASEANISNLLKGTSQVGKMTAYLQIDRTEIAKAEKEVIVRYRQEIP